MQTRSCGEILNALTYATTTGNSFLLKQDNARPHTARLLENFLEAEIVQSMEWISCSPELNWIKHVWDTLVRRIAP